MKRNAPRKQQSKAKPSTPPPEQTAPAPSILVTGDAGPDFDIYLHSDADNPPPGTSTAMRRHLGGAGLVQRLLVAWTQANFTAVRPAVDALAKAKTTLEDVEKKRDPGDKKPVQANDNARAEVVACESKLAEARRVAHIRSAQLPTPFPAPPTFGVWRPRDLGKDFAEKGDKKKVWRVGRSIGSGLCDPDSELPTPKAPGPLPEGFDPGVMVLVDHANCYRHPHGELLPHEDFWDRPDLPVVWKMAPPFCRGELWWRAVDAGVPARSVVVLTLSHLRTEAVRVSCRISWERTALEIARELEHNPALADLRSCSDVVVIIHGEGAVWRSWKADRPDEAVYHLIFDPANMEGEWSQEHHLDGDAYGYACAMTASLAAHLAGGRDRSAAIATAIPRGLDAMRLLHVLGHGPADEKSPPPELPAGRIALALRGDPAAFDGMERKPFGDFGKVEISGEEIAKPESSWRIAACGSQGIPLHGLARRFALFGERELGNIPHARFGLLLTADRGEIEALRNFKALIQAYESAKETKPLSLAVFGPPGAGKSFGVKQIAKQVLGEDCQILEFNLSQFAEADLAGAFHQVRDAVLRGKVPVVFWDEFDSSEYKWLKLLLAPMNDGVFQEGQITHPLGRCIFVFAGGTSDDAAHFGPKPPVPTATPPPTADKTKEAEAYTKFKLAKGPDFMSRLHGTLDILGPNPRQPRHRDGSPCAHAPVDVGFPLRRAILLRASLKLEPDARLEMDPGLLSALLETPRYTNGSRSFEKICVAIRDNAKGRKRYLPSDLPNDAVLAMNVDDVRDDDEKLLYPGTEAFKAILHREDNFKDKAKPLARAIHDVWRTGKRARVGTDKFNYDTDSDDLPTFKKNENIEAAMRMPRNLAAAGMVLVPADRAGNERVAEIPEHLIEYMAEEEHAGWLEVVLAEGYRQKQGNEERDDKKYIHECILSWQDLPDGQKGYDRDIVAKYPTYAEMAKFAIVYKPEK